MDVMELGPLAPEVVGVSGTGEGMHLRTRCNQPTSHKKCTLHMASVGRGKQNNSMRHASMNGWMPKPPVVRPTLQGLEDAPHGDRESGNGAGSDRSPKSEACQPWMEAG
jgi:hypothetical protein